MPHRECKRISLQRRDSRAALNARLDFALHIQRVARHALGRLGEKLRTSAAAWSKEWDRTIASTEESPVLSRRAPQFLSANPRSRPVAPLANCSCVAVFLRFTGRCRIPSDATLAKGVDMPDADVHESCVGVGVGRRRPSGARQREAQRHDAPEPVATPGSRAMGRGDWLSVGALDEQFPEPDPAPRT